MISDDTTDLYASVDVLASDFIARYRTGDRPTIEEYAFRHPELSESIHQVFPLVLSIEKVKVDQQSAADGSATLAGREIKQLGDFRIVREIGRGGMGIVYEAVQESLGRVVAIKVLPKQSLLDDEALERFHHEAKTAAAMHHTNIVPIFGTGASDGTHYLVMQLVRGSALDQRIASQGSDRSEFQAVARIGRQVADALSYSHANKVLHRDIKPANILIDDEGLAQITDFGLARNTSDDPTMTQSLSGSPRYMAPERFRGESDERSDLYGLGVTLYELLAGIPAFGETDPHQLMDAVRLHNVQPLRSLRSDIPVDLETIVLKAMSLEPTHRYQKAVDLQADLDRFLSDEPIHARRTSVPQRFTRWCRRNPRIAIATAVTAASLVIATIASTAGWALTSAANERTHDALDQSEQTIDLALQSLDGVVDLVSMPAKNIAEVGFGGSAEATWTLDPSPQSAEVLKRIQPLYERLSQQSPSRADIIGQMTRANIRLAFIQRQLGQTSAAIESLRRGMQVLSTRSERAEVSFRNRQLWLASLSNELGEVYSVELRFDEADRAFKNAIAALGEVQETDRQAQLQLARAHVALGDPPPQRRRVSGGTQIESPNPADNLRIANDLLESLHDVDADVSEVEILRARVRMAESRLDSRPAARRRNSRQAIDLLRKRLDAAPADVAVRFSLVEVLAGVNLRREIRNPRERMEAALRLAESLTELQTLRTQFPDTPVFSVSEVHIRHKLSSLARSDRDYSVAAQHLNEAVALQSALVTAAPNNLSHRCWRALLYRSIAEVCQLEGDSDRQRAAIESAEADLDAIRHADREHPFVVQTTEIIRSYKTLEFELRDQNAPTPN